MIDPFHLEAYGETTVNYNRDVEIFPVLEAIFKSIYGESPYKSPTDMGVNMVGFCISDDEVCREASKQEIIRRWYAAAVSVRKGLSDPSEVRKIELLMNSLGITPADRPVVAAALKKAEDSGGPAVALELNDGRIVTGKTTSLLGASSACLINALKALAGIDKKLPLIAPGVIKPIQHLKVEHLGNHNPRLHTDELLIALTICAVTNPMADLAIDQLAKLKGCEAHSTVILSHVDEELFKKLGVNISFEPKYQAKKLAARNLHQRMAHEQDVQRKGAHAHEVKGGVGAPIREEQRAHGPRHAEGIEELPGELPAAQGVEKAYIYRERAQVQRQPPYAVFSREHQQQ